MLHHSPPREYALSYRDGYDAGQHYTGTDTARALFRDATGRRTVRGHGRMHPATAAGWQRGFRHGLMDRAARRIASRVTLDGTTVTVEFPDEQLERRFDTAAEARRDAAICASAFGSYVFDRTPQACLAFA